MFGCEEKLVEKNTVAVNKAETRRNDTDSEANDMSEECSNRESTTNFVTVELRNMSLSDTTKIDRARYTKLMEIRSKSTVMINTFVLDTWISGTDAASKLVTRYASDTVDETFKREMYTRSDSVRRSICRTLGVSALFVVQTKRTSVVRAVSMV